MNVVTSMKDIRVARNLLKSPVGLVPTMGFLHDGHLSLVRNAKKQCSSVIVSIFVNPTQFGPGEDLTTYPRDLNRDLKMLEELKTDLVWTPTPEIMYPPDFQTWISVEALSRPLEGMMRPGHFRGVSTIVAKLFNAVQPNLAYFGQKDAQQVAVVKQMTRDLNFDLEIVVCPTVREPDGLALSSRNINLNPTERKAASVLYRSLSVALFSNNAGERDSQKVRRIIEEEITKEPLARLQYVSCANPDTLQEIEGMIEGNALLSMAVFIGKTRLIDNIVIGD